MNSTKEKAVDNHKKMIEKIIGAGELVKVGVDSMMGDFIAYMKVNKYVGRGTLKTPVKYINPDRGYTIYSKS